MTPRNFAWQAWRLARSIFESSFHVASAALGDIHLRFAWQAWHFWHWAWVWWRAWSPSVARDAAVLCLAAVALGDIYLCFTQAWHLATFTFVLRGGRGASGTGMFRIVTSSIELVVSDCSNSFPSPFFEFNSPRV